jgi:hypothetical protein
MQLLQSMSNPAFTALAPAFPNGFLPQIPLAVPPTPSPVNISAVASPVILPRKVSLEEFCQRYDVSAQDQAKLVILDVVPGDHDALLGLEREDWAAAGFAKLAWGRFLGKHSKFIEDVRNGLWT